MSIQFKFRSSVNFDSVDLDGKPYISIRDLRSKIVRQKSLNVCQDFDLVFSDAITGQEYNDEKFQIPSGSSVLIKRVPVGTVPSALEPIGLEANEGVKDLDLVAPVSGQPGDFDDFDDFGIDFCPVPDVTFPESYPEFDQKKCTGSRDEYIANSSSRWKHEASDLSEAVPRDSGAEGQSLQKMEFQEPMKMEKKASAHSLDPQYADLPSELRCPLCDVFFKQAVMIPCCQHSFCEKCIREVLAAEARCPKCSSTKCRVQDLLPNLSLRQAIEHFLEFRNLTTSMDNDLQKYAPDGESGIQAMNFSCAVAVTKRKPNMPSSPSATEKGSNQIMVQSFYKKLCRKNASLEGSSYPLPSSLRGRQFNGSLNGPEHLAAATNFQGENQPICWPQNHVSDEVDSTINRRGYWVSPEVTIVRLKLGFKAGVCLSTRRRKTPGKKIIKNVIDPFSGGERSLMTAGGTKKVDRTCYKCGSPDHFIRDCPVASTPHPMFQTGEAMFQCGIPGYASSYWNSAAFPPIQPCMNMYGNPGMMPFSANMVPITPYAVPQYVPSMYGGFPMPSGITRIGGLIPSVGTGADWDFENRRKLSNERRGQPFKYEADERHHYDELERSDEYKSHTARNKSLTESEDSRGRNLHRKHGHDKHLDERYEKDRRSYCSEKSKSGVEDMHHSVERYSDARHKQHHRSSKKHHESRGESDSDSNWKYHHSMKEKVVKSKLDGRGSKYKHKRRSPSGLEPCSSGDQKKHCKDRDHRHSLRNSKDRPKPIKDNLDTDGWQMADGSDEVFRDGYHHHKRKRD